MTLAMRQDNGRGTTPAVPASDSLSGFDQLLQTAEAVARSGFIPGVKTTEAALTLMLVCQAQGRHIGEAITRFHVIKGVPSVKADVQLADFQARGGICKWQETSASVARAAFSHPKYHPEPLVIEVYFKDLVDNGTAMSWDEKERKMTLRDIYRKSPASMLRARVVTQGVKAVDPGALHGFNSYEEAIDFDDGQTRVAELIPSPPPSRQLTEADPEVIGFSESGFDSRPYHQVVTEAVTATNELMRGMAKAASCDLAEVATEINPHDIHKRILYAAINLGYSDGPPPSKLREAIEDLTKVYKTERSWLRKELGSQLISLVDKCQEAIHAKVSAAIPDPAIEQNADAATPPSDPTPTVQAPEPKPAAPSNASYLLDGQLITAVGIVEKAKEYGWRGVNGTYKTSDAAFILREEGHKVEPAKAIS